MIKGLKFLNIFLMLLIFPISSLIIRGYLIYKYNPQEKEVIKSSTAVYKPVQNNIQSYASIIENEIFPSSQSRLTLIDLNKDISGEKVDKDKALLISGTREISFNIIDEEKIHVLPSPNQPAPQRYADLSPMSKKVGEKEWVIDQRAVFKAMEDMSQVLTAARLTPNVIEGKVEGFRITEIKSRGIFDAIGLKNGDILIRVNNYDIDTPEKAIQVISGIKGESRVHLDLMRDGQRVSFNYQIR